jgi:plastocyanin
MKYSASCLVAAAGVPLTLRFVNDDRGMLHNVQIFTANPVTTPGARSLFKGTIVTGPGSIAYAIPVLRAGTYYFHCDIHPQQMFGTLVVTR